MDGCLKKIVDEKSSFGNGWRFFYVLKERGDRLWRENVRRGDGRRMGEREDEGGKVVAGSTSALPDGAV